MYNSLTRLQNVFGFFTSVAFAVAVIIAASDLLSPRTPSGVIVELTELLPQTDPQPDPYRALTTAACRAGAPCKRNSVKGRPHYYSTKKEEYAVIKFSLDADLSSLFTWNTKQLFVYVTAEWPSAANETNKAVIWDSIITSPSADHLSNLGPATLRKLRRSAAGKKVDPSRGRLALKNQKAKYQITHPSGRIAEAADDVVLRLHYNVQPWVGALTWDQQPAADYGRWRGLDGGVSDPFAFPPLKQKKKDGDGDGAASGKRGSRA